MGVISLFHLGCLFQLGHVLFSVTVSKQVNKVPLSQLFLLLCYTSGVFIMTRQLQCLHDVSQHLFYWMGLSYSWNYWREIKFGRLEFWKQTAKFKSANKNCRCG